LAWSFLIKPNGDIGFTFIWLADAELVRSISLPVCGDVKMKRWPGCWVHLLLLSSRQTGAGDHVRDASLVNSHCNLMESTFSARQSNCNLHSETGQIGGLSDIKSVGQDGPVESLSQEKFQKTLQGSILLRRVRSILCEVLPMGCPRGSERTLQFASSSCTFSVCVVEMLGHGENRFGRPVGHDAVQNAIHSWNNLFFACDLCVRSEHSTWADLVLQDRSSECSLGTSFGRRTAGKPHLSFRSESEVRLLKAEHGYWWCRFPGVDQLRTNRLPSAVIWAFPQLVKTMGQRLAQNPVGDLRLGCERFKPIWPEEE
jgi:hypothetical protein